MIAVKPAPDAATRLILPRDRRVVSGEGNLDGIHTAPLPAELLDKMAEAASGEESGAFALVAAGLSALFSRLSGQSRFSVGVRGAEGDFYHVLVDVPRHMPFSAVLEQWRHPRHDAEAAQPSVWVLLAEDATVELPPCDLAVVLSPTAVEWRYVREYFLPDTLVRFSRHFHTLLNSAIAGMETCVGQLPLLTEAERNDLIFGFNDGEAAAEGELANLAAMFEESVRNFPKRPAVSCDGVTLSYLALNQRANRLAHHLISLGAEPDQLIGLCVDRGIDLVVALLAILKSGAAYLPIDPQTPAERVRFMLEDSGAKVLVTEQKLAARFADLEVKLARVDDTAVMAQEPSVNPGVAISLDALAYAIYTSGSTGQPKGCLLTHRNVARLMKSTEHWFGFHEEDVWTLFHSVAFDFSVWEIWGALAYGGKLVVVPYLTSRSPEDFLTLLSEEGVTVLNQTPSAFRQLIAAEQQREAPASLALRYVIFGGEALEMQSLRPWFERHGDRSPQLVNMYGITETTVHVTYRSLTQNDLANGSVIGVPIPDLRLYVLDEDQQPVPIGVCGELYVGGAGLAKGYLNRPELTAARFLPDFLTGAPEARLYRTGDLARILPDRDLEYLGRIDQQVKIRGFRVELGEVESQIAAFPGVAESAVIVRETETGDKRLVAYVVKSSGANFPSTALRSHLESRLPAYMVPADLIFLPTLPLNQNGKLDRAALPMEAPPELENLPELPRNATESALAKIWTHLLRRPSVGIHENFFELGGDSILAIHLVAEARKIGLPLRPFDVFEHPTIAGLAAPYAMLPEGVAPAPPTTLTEETLPLLPYHRWFLSQPWSNPHANAHLLILTVSERLNLHVLHAVFRALVDRHEALRLRLGRNSDSCQIVPAGMLTELLVSKSLTGLASGRLSRSLQEISRELIESLHVMHGPVFRAAYLDLGDDRPGRLVLAAHPFAFDTHSWRVLVTELEQMYVQALDGRGTRLHSPPASLLEAVERFSRFENSPEAAQELLHWQRLVGATDDLAMVRADMMQFGPNTEESAAELPTAFTEEETQALLRRPARELRMTAQETLIAALAYTFQTTQSQTLFRIDLEGESRDPLFERDSGALIGPFAAPRPVVLSSLVHDDLRTHLLHCKEQLREHPLHLPTHLGESSHLTATVLRLQGDWGNTTNGSEMLAIAPEFNQSTLSLNSLRTHALEITAAIFSGRLQITWRHSRNLHRTETIMRLAGVLQQTLRDILRLCERNALTAATPSDFPLAGLDQAKIDAITARGRISDIFPLSPIQTLFYAASAAKPNAGYDQWRGTITGPLHLPAFQDAWTEVLRRHPILRVSIVSENLPRPLQIVHEGQDPPWEVEDWREMPLEQQRARWEALLAEDARRPNDLSCPPLTRFHLVRTRDDEHWFLWSAPDLLLDGWSWPVLFGEVAALYRGYQEGRGPKLESARSYRDYVEWLAALDLGATEQFWKSELSGKRLGTPLPTETPAVPAAGFAEVSLPLDRETSDRWQSFARRHQLTPSVLIHAAWALLLARGANDDEVVFGSTFSGRPADFPGIQTIVGPFLNNLPLCLTCDRNMALHDFLKAVQEKLTTLSQHQFLGLDRMHDLSGLAWNENLFDSLVVFQNNLVDPSLYQLAEGVILTDFHGPVHTNYGLTLLVTPRDAWRLTLVYDAARCTKGRAETLLQSVVRMLDFAADRYQATLAEVMNHCLLEAGVATHGTAQPGVRQRQLPARTQMERTILEIWAKAFSVPENALGIHDNFFELGGRSLLLLRVHRQLCETLQKEISIVLLFQHPTIASLAACLDPHTSLAPTTAEQAPAIQSTKGIPALIDHARQRALAARAALARRKI